MSGKFIATECIDRLFLELSQFTRAATGKELELQAKCDRLEEALESLQELLDNDNFMEHNLDVSAKVIISQALNGEWNELWN